MYGKTGYLKWCVITPHTKKGESTICFYDTAGHMITGVINSDNVDNGKVAVSVVGEKGEDFKIVVPGEIRVDFGAWVLSVWVPKDRISFKT